MQRCLKGVMVGLSVLILFVTAGVTLRSQVIREFQSTLGGTAEEQGKGIIRAVDGSLIVVGHSRSYGQDVDVYVAKIDACGDLIWAKTYDINVDDYGSKIRECGLDNTFVIVGSTSHADGDDDAFLLKIDQTGAVVWCKTYGRNNTAPYDLPPHDVGNNLRIDAPTGVIYAVGHTRSVGAGAFDAWMWSVGPDGSLIWSYTYGGVEDDKFNGLDWTLDGDLIAVGSTRSFTVDRNMQILTVRINPPNGTVDWAFHRGGSDHEDGRSIAVNALGPYSYIVGRSGFDEYAERINFATGATIDEVVIHDADPSSVQELNEVVISDWHPYAIGSWQQSNGMFDMHVVDFPGGAMTPGLSRSYGGVDNDGGAGIVRVYDFNAVFDSIAMVGTTASFGLGGSDVYVVAAYNNGFSGCNEHDQPFRTFDPDFTSGDAELVRTEFPQCEERVIAASHDDYRVLCEQCGEERIDVNVPGGMDLSGISTGVARPSTVTVPERVEVTQK